MQIFGFPLVFGPQNFLIKYIHTFRTRAAKRLLNNKDRIVFPLNLAQPFKLAPEKLRPCLRTQALDMQSTQQQQQVRWGQGRAPTNFEWRAEIKQTTGV